MRARRWRAWRRFTRRARRTLQREITILKNKNVELSVFAGKAASYDALKLRAETEIASLKKTHDAEITALKAQIAGLEKTIETVEREMAEGARGDGGEARRLAVRARRRQAPARLGDAQVPRRAGAERRARRVVASRVSAHRPGGGGEARGDRETIRRVHGEQRRVGTRANAASTMEKALAELKRVSESKLEAAVAQALGERTALKTPSENELEKAERKRETNFSSRGRAAVAEAESRVAGDWRAKLEKIEAVNKNIAKTFNAEFERQRVAMASASAAEQDALRASHEATARAAARSTQEGARAGALAARTRSPPPSATRCSSSSAWPPPPARRFRAAPPSAALAEEQRAMRAQLDLERDEAVAAARDEPSARRAPRIGALYAHFRSEAAKTDDGGARAAWRRPRLEAAESLSPRWNARRSACRRRTTTNTRRCRARPHQGGGQPEEGPRGEPRGDAGGRARGRRHDARRRRPPRTAAAATPRARGGAAPRAPRFDGFRRGQGARAATAPHRT